MVDCGRPRADSPGSLPTARYPYHLARTMSKRPKPRCDWGTNGVWDRGQARECCAFGPRVRRVVGLATLALGGGWGCRPEPSVTGCTKDVDCKGARVCVAGACVDPPTGTAVAGDPERLRTGAPGGADAAAPGAGPWYWRGGPGGQGAGDRAAPARAPTLRWSVTLGSTIVARPTLAATADGSEAAWIGDHGGRFVGVITTGPRAGQIDTEVELGGMVWGTAAASGDGRLFVGADDDKLYAIDPATRTIAWAVELGDCDGDRVPGPEGARCDVDGGPTIGPDGDLFVGADGLYRIDPRDGAVRWQAPAIAPAPPDKERSDARAARIRRAHVYAAPLVTAAGRVAVAGQDGAITLFDGEGRTLWRYVVRADVDGAAVATRDGGIIAASDDGRVHALRSDGSLRWSFVAQGDIRSAVAITADGELYVTAFDGNLYALAEDGAVRWVYATGSRIASSPIVDRDGRVLFGAQDGRLYAVERDGALAWTVEIGADVDGTVAITSEGLVIVGADDGVLRAYGDGGGSRSDGEDPE